MLQIFLKTSLNAPLCYKMQDISDLCYPETKLHAVTLNYSSLKQGNVSCSPLCLDFTAIQGGNKLPLIFHKNKCTAVILLAKFYRHICSNQPCLAIRNSNFLYTARALNVKVDQKKENEFSWHGMTRLKKYIFWGEFHPHSDLNVCFFGYVQYKSWLMKNFPIDHVSRLEVLIWVWMCGNICHLWPTCMVLKSYKVQGLLTLLCNHEPN